MAENFTVIGSYATVQVTGASSAVDVLRITARTIPSGVVFTANAPYKQITGVREGDVQGIADMFIGPLATGIERMMGIGVVAAAVAVEDTDAAGLLVDYVDATVSYDPPGSSQEALTQVVRIPAYAFDEPSLFGSLVGGVVNGAYDGLKALAAA